MPYMLARRLPAAKMNSACRGSAGLNSMGVGGFFAPDLPEKKEGCDAINLLRWYELVK